MKDLFIKYRFAFLSFSIFVLIGIVVWIIRDFRYFLLFFGIGTGELVMRSLVVNYPKRRQLLRIVLQSFVGGYLLIHLSIIVTVNFQFIEVFFDATAGVVTGALIQLIIARTILPFFLGNAFCSRACWTGLFFELSNTKKCEKPVKRSNWLAWGYLIFIVLLGILVAQFFKNPAMDEHLRRTWIIAENLFIITIGFVLTFSLGSRAYCRLLCPFITISGIFSPYSLFKITPVKADECTACNKCTKVCPMLIDVKHYATSKKRINHRQCILCERCVSACSKDVLQVSSKKPK